MPFQSQSGSRCYSANILSGVVSWVYYSSIVLIYFSYIQILLLLRHKLHGTVTQQADVVLSKAKKNVRLTMLIAGIMFFICWTPMETMRLLFSLDVISTREPAVARVRAVFTGLVMCNMSVNPAVYCFKYEHFRTQLMELVRSRFGRNRVRPGEESTDRPTWALDPTTQQTASAPVN